MEITQRAQRLTGQMTLEEKISQIVHGAAPIERLGVPAYNWWNEALHGVARSGTATVFPQAIGLAATFDEELLFEVAEIISREGRAKYNLYQQEGDTGLYKGLTFWSPNINIFRDPRWGRGHETYGEDPYLTARLGVAFIRGMQGDDPDVLRAAACAKHFAVHSGPEATRHEFDAVVSDYDLWNTYLPAFEAAVKEGRVEAVMGAYNRLRGVPCCGNHWLLTQILRDKWGFRGHVVSDCGAINDFFQFHKVCESAVDSTALAVKAGCDLNCGSTYGYANLAVEQGLLREEDVTRSVERLMATRMRLGILGEHAPNAYDEIPADIVDCDAHREANLRAARKGLVLLKNDGVLPLDAKALRTLAVIGPNADNRRTLEGNYYGTASDIVTPLRGLTEKAKEYGFRVRYASGCHLFKDGEQQNTLDDRLAEAVAAAKAADATVLFLGIDADLEGEAGDAFSLFPGGDKPTLVLPGRQMRLLEEVVKAAGKKPVVLVNVSGSAVDLSWASEHVGSILQVFYPGALGGQAVAEALLGEISPEGKLPVTFYRSDADLPDFLNYDMEGRTYRYFRGEALYPFGFGLGYAKFSLVNAVVDGDAVIVTVANAGKVASGEAIQLYAACEGTRERWNLCGVRKIFLEPGEIAEVRVPLSRAAFCRYDANGDLQPVSGQKTLYVGFCQPDERSAKLYGQAPIALQSI